MQENSSSCCPKFPSDKQRRQSWTIALRREGFEPKDRTVLCSCHFGLKILTRLDRQSVYGKERSHPFSSFLIIFQSSLVHQG
ncbi:hypothetical protein QQF64_018369 [Cirrhinus molitorella]|uniref:THAP-type domain-containing protein n=1 Tax=Cirrhinus molitorella TaxID=172907 RepID=A0ABR3LCJ6_9TELE